MATSDRGLGSPLSRDSDRPESRDSKSAPGQQPSRSSPHGQPTPPPTSSPSPHHRYSTPLPPDQNSNSVRDLENAMSKHLPRDKEASTAGLGLIPSSLPGGPSLEASHLLKQIYSRPGYFPDLEPGAVSAESSQFLNYARLAGTTGYPSASPAQPVPLKPNVYPPGAIFFSVSYNFCTLKVANKESGCRYIQMGQVDHFMVSKQYHLIRCIIMDQTNHLMCP